MGYALASPFYALDIDAAGLMKKLALSTGTSSAAF